MSPIRFRHFIGGIASARLRDPHLTRSKRAFSATLSTPALDRRTSRWFAISPCRATAKGHQTTRPGSFISRAAPHPSVSPSTSILLQRSRHTIVGVALERAARQVAGHPGVEREVHEQVRQDRRDRRPLRCSLASLLKGAIWARERGG